VLLKLSLFYTVTVSLLHKFPAVTFVFPFLEICWSSINSVVVPRYLTVRPREWMLERAGERTCRWWQMGCYCTCHPCSRNFKAAVDQLLDQHSLQPRYVLKSIPGKLGALSGKLVNQVASDEPPRCPSCSDSTTWEEKGGVGSWVWRTASAL